jgi:hypothetical protein
VETWPIEEFTYLKPSRWNGTLSVERRARIEEYWRAVIHSSATARERRASRLCFAGARMH